MIDIIFPTLNNLEFTKDCLRTFKKYTREEFRIFVVDGGSTDGTEKFLTDNKKEYNIEEIINCPERNISKVYNSALERTSSDYVLLLTNDLLFSNDALTPLAKTLDNYEEVGIVGSKLLYPNDTIQHAGMIFDHRSFEPYHVGRFERKEKHSEYMQYPCVTLTFALMRRKAVPLFNEKYLYNYEDVDLCMTVGMKHKIVYCPESCLYHYESVTTTKHPNFHVMREQSRILFHSLWDEYLRDQFISSPDFWFSGRRLEGKR
jgi:GT2 family glycosyltransferase